MIKPDSFYKPYSKILITIVLISGFILTAIGLFNLSWPQAIPLSDTGAQFRFFGFLAVAAIIVSLIVRMLHLNASLAAMAVAVFLAIGAGALWPLLVTLWFAGASSILGYWLLGKLKINGAAWLNCFLIGAGVYGTAVGLLAHFPVNYPGVYGVALALPLMLGWRVVVTESKSFLARANKSNPVGFGLNVLDVAIAVVALVYFVVALMPEVGFDSLAMHLFIPGHLSLRHQWGFDAGTYVWAVMPMLGDWIFSIGYMLADEPAARLINVGFIFVLGRLVRDIVMWADGSAVGARWAVLIFLSMPLAFTEGSSLYIESVWASFVIAGSLAILSSCSTSGKPRFELPVAGFLLGCALAAKAVTFTVLPGLLLLLVWRYKTWYKATGLPYLVIGLSLFLAIGIIPYATAWRLAGNPVFPLYNKIFQSPYYITSENFYNPLYTLGITWDVIYRITFESGKYLEASAGASGFQWLLLFIPAVITLIAFKRLRAIAVLLIGIFSFAMVFNSQSYLRYAFPSLIILIAATGVALGSALSARSFVRYLWGGAAVITVALNLLFFNAGGFYRDFALESIPDKSSRERYLQARLPIKSAVKLVNQLNVEQTPVAVFAEPLAAGISADALYPCWYNFVFQREVISIHAEQDVADILLKRGVNYVILDANWNGVNCCPGEDGLKKQALIEKATEKIAEYGTFSVRKIKINSDFKTELLTNPDFASINGWVLAANTKYDANTGIILAGVDSSSTQRVAVTAGRRYLNTVSARCAKEPTLGRIQINWFDTKGQFVSTDIKTFECTPTWSEHAMEVAAPPNTINAEVYVTGHSLIPLEFKSNSLRQ